VIIPDVNVLVYAFRADSPRNDTYRDWLRRAVVGAEVVGLTDLTASGFLRIVTHRKVFADPAPVSIASQFVTRLLQAPASRWVGESRSSWHHLTVLAADDSGVTGNRVPDAYLAAIAIAHGARIATADRGFARYSGLRFFDPCHA
jgi:uncharacterized protein